MKRKTIGKTLDKILPNLKLPREVDIEIKMDDEYVYLYIGQRDWQFYKDSGKLMGCGTSLPIKY